MWYMTYYIHMIHLILQKLVLHSILKITSNEFLKLETSGGAHKPYYFFNRPQNKKNSNGHRRLEQDGIFYYNQFVKN